MKYTVEKDLLPKAEKIFEKESKLITLSSFGNAIFVGDTHGDFDATKKVVSKYLKDNNKIIFLGDYVDRGFNSKENIDYLLTLKIRYPKDIFLLMGNHEAYTVKEFYPADFWLSLVAKQKHLYGLVLTKLPLVVSANGIIALHGALPDVKDIKEIDKISVNSEKWDQIVWGDWQEESGMQLGEDMFTGRPQFGQGYFDKIMGILKKNVLIRSHQPNAPQVMYNKRCLTIFASHAYLPKRTIAIVNLEKEVKSTDDLIIKEI